MLRLPCFSEWAWQILVKSGCIDYLRVEYKVTTKVDLHPSLKNKATSFSGRFYKAKDKIASGAPAD
jgi:hypothetical protein